MNIKALFNRHLKSATIVKSSGVETDSRVLLMHPDNIDITRRSYIFQFTSPSGYVAPGDFIVQDGVYHIVATTEDNTFSRQTVHTTGIAFRCNAEVVVKRYFSGSGFVTQAGTVKACITSTRLYALDDRSLGIDVAGKRRSSEPRYYCYVRSSEDILEKDKLYHGTRSLEVLDNIDPYFASGVREVSVVIED